MKRRLLRCLFLAGMITGVWAGPAAHAQTAKRPWKLSATVATMYDDNILRYSEKYIERFDRGQDAGRFHINSTDDLVLQSSVTAERFFRIRRGWTSVLFGEIRNRTYSRNSIKNWSTLGVGIRQRWETHTILSVSYIHLPDFYVRHYRDEDWVRQIGYTPDTFKPYSYSRNEIRTWLQHTLLKNVRVRLSYSHQWYYHNQHFTEYDSRNNIFGVDISRPVHKNVRVSLGYRFISSNAKGFDEPGETKAASDDVDATYNQDGVRGGVEWQLPRLAGLRTRLAVDAEYARKAFTTKKDVTTDPLHAGRVDNDYGVSVSYAAEAGKNITLAAIYEWRCRDAGSKRRENSGFISDEKDFSQSRLGLEFRYVLNF